jgi:hypothetical protein
VTTIAVASLFFGAAASADQSAQIYNVADGNSPAIATDYKGQLHVALEERDKDLNLVDVYYVQSLDGAKTFTTPFDISDPGKSSIADIAIEKNGAIDVAWSYTTSVQNSPDIFLARSPNGGTTWATQVDISNTPGVSSQPDVAVGPDNKIHVVWKDTTSGEKRPDIFYCFSSDSGASWSNPESVSSTAGPASEPAIAVGEDGTVYVAWEDTAGDRSAIYYSRRVAGAWSKPSDMSKSPNPCSHPDIACGPKGMLYICWAENSQTEKASDVWCCIGNKHGQFGKPFNVSNTPGPSRDPALVADASGRVAIVWSDTTSGDTTADIFGKISLDGGGVFSNPVDFSNKEGMSIHPDVALAGSKLFVVWEDFQPTKSVVKGTSMEIQGTATVPPCEAGSPVHQRAN